jgi:hypothetical protein
VWKPTRRGRKDPPANSQYITTRLGVCPVVIGPHIFPDTRFLSVRKVDEKMEKAEKQKLKAAKVPKAVPLPKPHPPATPAPTSASSHSNALTVKALTEIASASPEFSAILQAVANKTATPEQNAALTQYMRAASLIPKTPVTTIPGPTPRPLAQTPVTQSAPIPPVPKSHPHAPVPTAVPPRLISTPVTRIPPPTGNVNPVPLPNVIRTPITTPVTRIPPPSTPSTPINTVPPTTPGTSIPPTTIPSTPSTPGQPIIGTPSTPTQPLTGPSLTTPSPFPQTPLPPAVDPMNFVEIGFELTEPGERLLIPRHTILEKFVSPQGGNNVLASFIITLNNNTVYIPITLKLSDCPPRIWESLHKYVFPQVVVAQEMEKTMKECKRFEKSILQLTIPVEEEGFQWNGIKKEVERKKYQRKKKEKKEDGEDKEGADSPATKKKKSLVVGLKYTPTKNENATQKEAGPEKDTPTKMEPEEPMAPSQ